MSSHITEQAIRDVVPSLSEKLPEQLRQLTSTLYQASKQKINLKPSEEIARQHLSAYIAVDRLQERLDLPAPSLKNLPIPSKSAAALVSIFKLTLLSDSTSSTPLTTPRKRPNPSIADIPITPSPQKRSRGRPPGSRSKTSFQKRLEAAAATDASTFSPSKSTTPHPSSPLKDHDEKQLNQDLKTSEPSLSDLKLLTSREITSLCNKFQLDQEIAENILQTFQKYSTKISNEWTLIVGLVLNCYFVVNHKALQDKIGSKTAVIKSMLNLQDGGLRLVEIQQSLDLVKDLIVYNKWFKLLKVKYDYPFYEMATLDKSGSMISPRYQFSSKQANDEYEEWLGHVQSLMKTT